MRRVPMSLLVLALVSAPSIVGAQVEATKRAIAALEETWIKAVIDRDARTFDRLLAPGFVYTEDDRVYTKQQLIQDITTSTDTVTAGRNEDLTVRVFGTTAIATGWLILIGRGPRGKFETRFRYTDTWARIGSRWVVVAAHDYKKP